jgi:hypothetical protein
MMKLKSTTLKETAGATRIDVHRKSQVYYDYLDDILFSRRKYPWTQEEFLKYLKTVYSEENFEFMIEFIKLKSIESKEVLQTESKRVFETFVVLDSPKQLNVSSTLREKAEKQYQNDSSDIDTIYQGIYDEVRKLMMQGLHIQNFQERNIQNLNVKSMFPRLIVCFVWFALAIGISFTIIFLSSNRWQRLASFPIWYIFSALSVFRVKRMCPIGTFFKNRRDENTGEYVKVEDFSTLIALRQAERNLHLVSLFVVIGVSVIIVGVPVIA